MSTTDSGKVAPFRVTSELENTDAPLDHYYAYDEMEVVLEGTLRHENLEAGQVDQVGPKDAILFPKGSRIRFTTPDRALAFFIGHRSFAP